MNVDFTIKNPLWLRVAIWVVTAIGFIALAVTTILYFTIFMERDVFIILEAAAAVIAALGLVCGYVGEMEKFELKEGVFSYRKPFKKKQSAFVQDIDRVEVHGPQAALLVDIVFYGEDGKKLINFLDDGTAFRGGKLERALQELYIPLIRK